MKSLALVLGGVLALFAGGRASAQTAFQKETSTDGTLSLPSTDEVLYEQLDDPSGKGFTDQAFESIYYELNSVAADDFVVTSALGWDITTVNTPGFLSGGTGQIYFVNTVFYADNGAGEPGAVLAGCDFPANTDFTTDGTGDLSVDVACHAPEGVTWVSQQVRLDACCVGGGFGQHFWATRNAARGSPFVWKNPSNGFGTGCTNWTPAWTCGSSGDDALFQILGKERTVASTGPVPAVAPVGIVLMLLALAAGGAVLGRRRGT